VQCSYVIRTLWNPQINVLNEDRAYLLPRAKSTVQPRPGIRQYTTKNFGVRRAVNTEEREAAKEESKEITSTETSEVGSSAATRASRAKMNRILEPERRKVAVSGKPSGIREVRKPVH